MDNLQADMQKMIKDVKTLLSRKLSVASGKFATQHFQDNFWPPAKRLSSCEQRVKDAVKGAWLILFSQTPSSWRPGRKRLLAIWYFRPYSISATRLILSARSHNAPLNCWSSSSVNPPSPPFPSMPSSLWYNQELDLPKYRRAMSNHDIDTWISFNFCLNGDLFISVCCLKIHRPVKRASL